MGDNENTDAWLIGRRNRRDKPAGSVQQRMLLRKLPRGRNISSEK